MLLEDEQLAADFEGVHIGGLEEPKPSMEAGNQKHVSKKKVSKKKRRKNKEKAQEEEQKGNVSESIELNVDDQNEQDSAASRSHTPASSPDNQDQSEDAQLDNESEDEESFLIRMAAAHSQPRAAAAEEEEEEEYEDDEDAFLHRMAAAQSNVKSKEPQADPDDSEDESDDEDEGIFLNGLASQKQKSASNLDSNDGIASSKSGLPKNGKDSVENAVDTSNAVEDTSQSGMHEGDDEEVEIVTTHAFLTSKMSKAKAAKKARKAKKKGLEVESDLQCQLCGEPFGSRNALFKHIRETGHAAYK